MVGEGVDRDWGGSGGERDQLVGGGGEREDPMGWGWGGLRRGRLGVGREKPHVDWGSGKEMRAWWVFGEGGERDAHLVRVWGRRCARLVGEGGEVEVATVFGEKNESSHFWIIFNENGGRL
ncbi:hypothetical protein E2542_SST20360 [Spatholobus suberectus]|nr:hypothetical protein E2542_SST20360 [Spatholobus suberectus]